MFGMAGGSAGQFAVGPLMKHGFRGNSFGSMPASSVSGWLRRFFFLPAEAKAAKAGGGLKSILLSLGKVFKNPQSILRLDCGVDVCAHHDFRDDLGGAVFARGTRP